MADSIITSDSDSEPDAVISVDIGEVGLEHLTMYFRKHPNEFITPTIGKLISTLSSNPFSGPTRGDSISQKVNDSCGLTLLLKKNLYSSDTLRIVHGNTVLANGGVTTAVVVTRCSIENTLTIRL